MNQSNQNRPAALKSIFLLILAFAIVYKLPVILVQMKVLAEGVILWGGSIGIIVAFLYVVSDPEDETYNPKIRN